MAWQREKFDAGYGAIQWPVEFGGSGLAAVFEEAFDEEQADFVTPGHHETFSVTLHLVAPTVRAFGTPEQQRELIPRFLRTTELCCQLFSEPGAGSDLASLSTRAVREGDEWVVNGQKTWSSGARLSSWGELIGRSDATVPKHAGQTAFIVPMDATGITVVPIRQMSGGASFNEVFFDDVRIPDRYRLGAVGEGWKVALTTLGFERSTSGSDRGDQAVGGSFEQLRALAEWLGATTNAADRQDLARLYSLDRIRGLLAMRAAARARIGGTPGPEASVGKLLWTQWMTAAGELAARLLGPRILADTGEWGTYAWTDAPARRPRLPHRRRLRRDPAQHHRPACARLARRAAARRDCIAQSSLRGNRDAAATPPSTTIVEPVVNDERSEARYSAAPTISVGWPRRCRG